MDCIELLDALVAIETGATSLNRAALQTWVAAGWVQVPGNSSASEGEPLRHRLGELRARREAVRAAGVATAGGAPSGELAALDAEEAGLRARLVALSVATAAAPEGSVSPSLTLAGRELVDEMTSRRARLAGLTVEAFQSQLAALREAIALRAGRAAIISKAIAVDPRGYDESGCRAAAVTLSSIVGRDVIASWRLAVQGLATLPLSHVGSMAEAVVLAQLRPSADPGAVARALARFRALGGVPVEDAHDTVCVLLEAEPSSEPALADRSAALAARLAGPQAPLALLALSGWSDERIVVELPALERQLVAILGAADHARFAAAVLLLGPVPQETALARLERTLAWLGRFGGGAWAPVAALLTLIDADSDEVLDDLRLAAAEVERAGLSIDAYENLAFAAQMLLGAERPTFNSSARIGLPSMGISSQTAAVWRTFGANYAGRNQVGTGYGAHQSLVFG